MKVRHPYQVMRPEDLILGESYVFVGLSKLNGRPDASYADGPRVFADKSDRVGYFSIDADGNMPNGQICASGPTIIYQSAGRNTWDRVSTFFEERVGNRHSLMVVADEWLKDPKIHVVDWINPDDVVELASPRSESHADFEARMRAKVDAQLRGLFT